MYEIRLAKLNDRNRIINFIYSNWNTNHIFVKSKSFFDYEFLREQDINFVIAENSHGDIIGILGFIQYSKLLKNSDLFTVMWMVSESSRDLALGLKLYYFILDLKPKSISSVGVNKATLKFYDYLGFKTGKLKHFYYINNELESYRISRINNITKTFYENINSCDKKIVEINGKDIFEKNDFQKLTEPNNIYKSIHYLTKRYVNHPFYKYRFLNIVKSDQVEAMMVVREQQCFGHKILRIIDYFGPSKAFRNVGFELNKIILANNYEYIDFYQFGLDDEDLHHAGFIENDFTNIIPNYFEPYTLKNIDINFFTNIEKENIYLFKGDGDQDRPNLVIRGD